jgi:hypothetical protein
MLGEDSELLCFVVYDKTGKEIIDNYFVVQNIWQDFSARIDLAVYVGLVALDLEFHSTQDYKEYLSYLDARNKPSVTCPNCGEEKDPNDSLIIIAGDCYHVREDLWRQFKSRYEEYTDTLDIEIEWALADYVAGDDVRAEFGSVRE